MPESIKGSIGKLTLPPRNESLLIYNRAKLASHGFVACSIETLLVELSLPAFMGPWARTPHLPH